jgi:PAT family beta-lactamase induction signal transducer AmpG
MSAAFILLTLSIPIRGGSHSGQGYAVSLFTFTLILFIITAFASATHDIAADGFYMLAANQEEQSFFVGIRSTFDRLSSIFGQGVLVYIAGLLEKRTGDIPMAWQMTMAITAVMFTCLSVYHLFFIPRPAADTPHLSDSNDSKAKEILREFGHTFATYFQKPGVWLAIVFMLPLPPCPRLSCQDGQPLPARCHKQGRLGSTPTRWVFLWHHRRALSHDGGIIADRRLTLGTSPSLWPMAACMTLPCATFVYSASPTPTTSTSFRLRAVEQFGYGFGFTPICSI